LIPTTACDEYFAELALWFGVPRTDLELVLPNIRRFYDPASTNAPVGYLIAPSQSRSVTPEDRREQRLERITPRNGRRGGAVRS